MVQCPVLCGRIASSLTSTASPVSKSSTASIPRPRASPRRRARPAAPGRTAPRRARARAPRPPCRCPRPAGTAPRDRRRPGHAASAPPARRARGRSPPSPPPTSAPRGQHSAGHYLRGLRLRTHHPHALAVVAAAGNLQHHRPGAALGEELDVIGSATTAQRGLGRPAYANASRMTICVLGMYERSWPRAHGDSPLDELEQMVRGTCSWSNVTTSQPSAKASRACRSSCAPITVSGITWAAGRPVRREHPEVHVQGFRRRGGHPSELPAAHDANDRPGHVRTSRR